MKGDDCGIINFISGLSTTKIGSSANSASINFRKQISTRSFDDFEMLQSLIEKMGKLRS